MFMSGFQSSSAIAKNMVYTVGVLSAHPDFAEELRQELDGQASTLTISIVVWCTFCTTVICITCKPA